MEQFCKLLCSKRLTFLLFWWRCYLTQHQLEVAEFARLQHLIFSTEYTIGAKCHYGEMGLLLLDLSVKHAYICTLSQSCFVFARDIL